MSIYWLDWLPFESPLPNHLETVMLASCSEVCVSHRPSTTSLNPSLAIYSLPNVAINLIGLFHYKQYIKTIFKMIIILTFSNCDCIYDIFKVTVYIFFISCYIAFKYRKRKITQVFKRKIHVLLIWFIWKRFHIQKTTDGYVRASRFSKLLEICIWYFKAIEDWYTTFQRSE